MESEKRDNPDKEDFVLEKNASDSHHPLREDIVRVREVSVSFGQHVVLNKTSFEIKEGEIFGIIGMSGSGKTTLLTTIVGALKPQEGDVLFQSKQALGEKKFSSVFKNLYLVGSTFGFAAQIPSFYPELTVWQNLEYFGALYDLPEELVVENAKRALKLVGLFGQEHLQAKFLSGGMQKKLDIACAIIHNPSILILDEPTADLDPITRGDLLSLFKKINKEGKTIIIASHFLMELEFLCHRIGILHEGHIAEVGTVEELRRSFSNNKEIHLQTANGKYDIIVEKLRKTKLLEITQIVDKGHKLVIYTPEAEAVLHHLLVAVKESSDSIVNVDVARPSLNEVFEKIIRHK
ncbi:MAG: ABC transporter ATP-binding protein [Candidatus Woesearchaeota archaeon]|nr:ABC transporter ATP-binding protein [Candidatus Woesearchaeota archaeon]